MADGKWIPGLLADTPTPEAARKALSFRLGVVVKLLPLAVEKAHEDVEHVHQLRVATRRSAAAIRSFRRVLPSEEVRNARHVLRSLRRAAGAARDWDVFLAMVQSSSALQTTAGQPALDFLTGYATGRRVEAQELLAAAALGFTEPLAELKKRLEPRNRSGKLAKHAIPILEELLGEFSAGVKANPTTPETIHELRIAGKRTRYAMELFAGCFRPEFKNELYPAIERAQEILGTIHDGNVSMARLTAIRNGVQSPRVRSGIAMLIGEVKSRTTAQKQIFRAWRSEWSKLIADQNLSPRESDDSLRREGSGKTLGRRGTGSSKPRSKSRSAAGRRG